MYPDQRNSLDSRPRKIYRILAGKLFDSYTGKLISDQLISVDREAGIILDVQPLKELHARSLTLISQGYEEREGRGTAKDSSAIEVIDLRHLTILPGFVDAHVHLFLHPYSETSWQDQLTKESLAERTLRAGVHSRKTLMAGFTTVRDLGTEGAADADIALRKCLSNRGKDEAIIIGPRYYCSTRAIVCTGSYGPRSTLYPAQNGVEGVTGAEIADGVDECVRTVRRQIGAGADWVKIYADYHVRAQTSDVSPKIAARSFGTFNQQELGVMIDTAHDLVVKVAAHANTADAVEKLLDLGVDTIEHGGEIYGVDREDATGIIRKLMESGTIWVPTLAAYYSMAMLGLHGAEDTWERMRKTFQKIIEVNGPSGGLPGAGKRRVRIACGGDTGTFAHGENGLEMVLMRKLGADWDLVLRWGTLGGWECVRGMEWEGVRGRKKVEALEDSQDSGNNKDALERDVPFGAVRKSWAGDLIGIEGCLDKGVEEFEKAIMKGVKFVMKGGRVYKTDRLSCAAPL